MFWIFKMRRFICIGADLVRDVKDWKRTHWFLLQLIGWSVQNYIWKHMFDLA